MFKVLRGIIFTYLCISFVPNIICSGEKIRFLSTEHPCLSYFNPKLVTFANLTSQQYGRSNPLHFVGLHFTTLTGIGNNLTIDFYFYEYLSNVYKRSFVELRFKWCDLVHNGLFGGDMKQGKLAGPCPYPPGEYHLYNMTVDMRFIPRGFPFIKGRVIANATFPGIKEIWGTAHMDIEVKEINVRRRTQSNVKLRHPP